MTEWLTHALIAYSAATVLSWQFEEVTPAMVSAAMVGALVPDLVKIWLVLPSSVVESLFGIPFSWVPLHNLGGSLIGISIVTILVPAGRRTLAFVSLSLGTFSHFFMDSFIYRPEGLASGVLWPLTTYRFEVSGVYVSWDRWPAVFAVGIAVGIWTLNRYRARARTDDVAGYENRPRDSSWPDAPPVRTRRQAEQSD